jgi:uncharacterized phage-associated protein
MPTVGDVARYFLLLGSRDQDEELTNLKLQKLVYYAYGYNLVRNDGQLFTDPLKAWKNGPVVPQLWHDFREHGSERLPVDETFRPSSIPDDVREVLDEVWQTYGQLAAWKLRNMTHEEPPWVEARARDERITDDAMLRHFRKVVPERDLGWEHIGDYVRPINVDVVEADYSLEPDEMKF